MKPAQFEVDSGLVQREANGRFPLLPTKTGQSPSGPIAVRQQRALKSDIPVYALFARKEARVHDDWNCGKLRRRGASTAS